MAPGENNKATMDIGAASDDDTVFIDKNVPSSIEPKSRAVAGADINDEYADEPDETLGERLWGLTEMFPESLRNFSYSAAVSTSEGIKGFYELSRNIVWIAISSSVVLFAPLILEVERAQMEDMQRTQQKQMLLGPNTALAGGPGAGVPMPPIHR